MALLSVKSGWSPFFTINYIKPFGPVSLDSLRSIPLIFVSLVVGITSLEDVTKLSRIGGETFLVYTATTLWAVVLGLVLVNLIKPGKVISEQIRDHLTILYTSEAAQNVATTQVIRGQDAPFQLFVDLVLANIVASMSNNENLLQVVLVAILLGVALLKITPKKSRRVVLFFEGLNDTIVELVRLIMKRIAYWGVCISSCLCW